MVRDGKELFWWRRRLIRVRYASLLAVAGAVAILAGCGSVQAGERVAPAVPAAPAVPTADVAAQRTPEQRAVASAAAMLAAFIPPPHAVRTGPLRVSLLAQPGLKPLSPDQVTRTGWWRVTGQPQAVLGWIQAHKLPGSAGGGVGGLTVRGSYVMWDTEFTLPAVPGVLTERELVVSIAADGPDRTAIRADAFVGWVPARPAADTIPASARMVTITPVAAAGQQVTVTDPARVARIAAAVNALPVYPPRSAGWCDIRIPPGGIPAMRLTFRTSAGSRELAIVTASQCQLVNVVIDGKTMPSLYGTQTLIQQVMAIAGVRWPDFPAPGPTTPAAAGP